MAESIIKMYEITGLLHFHITEEVHEWHIYKYKDRFAGIRIERKLIILTPKDETVL